MAKTPFLQVVGISKFFGAVRALDNVSLTVHEGEIIGLVGDNAAGKSTLMKICSGAYQPDKGRILVNGKEVRWQGPLDARHRGIEMIYQNLALAPNLDVATNIFLGRELVRKVLGFTVLNKREMRKRSLEILAALGLRVPPPTTRVAELSGGQQQAVAIARSTGFDAKLVIMDEPTANLSAAAITKVRETVVRLKARGIAVVIISHRLGDVLTTADRVVVMKHGRVVGERDVEKTNEAEVLAMIITGQANGLSQ